MLGLESPRKQNARLRWPPRLRAADVVAGFEGAPNRISVYQKAGRGGRFDASVFVFFGRRHSTRLQLARARSELRTARLP